MTLLVLSITLVGCSDKITYSSKPKQDPIIHGYCSESEIVDGTVKHNWELVISDSIGFYPVEFGLDNNPRYWNADDSTDYANYTSIHHKSEGFTIDTTLSLGNMVFDTTFGDTTFFSLTVYSDEYDSTTEYDVAMLIGDSVLKYYFHSVKGELENKELMFLPDTLVEAFIGDESYLLLKHPLTIYDDYIRYLDGELMEFDRTRDYSTYDLSDHHLYASISAISQFDSIVVIGSLYYYSSSDETKVYPCQHISFNKEN
jgi:hypothetical protein